MVLLAGQLGKRRSDPLAEVRFFHDSMQSFLTAEALFCSSQPGFGWDALLEAAGAPRFVNSGSELFQMCLQTYGPIDELQKRLANQMVESARLYYRSLTVDTVTNAVPAFIEQHLADDASPREVLLRAVDLCFQFDEANASSEMLGLLFAALAPVIWRLKKKKERAGKPENVY